MELAAELEACLKEFSGAGVVEIRENGGRVAPFLAPARGLACRPCGKLAPRPARSHAPVAKGLAIHEPPRPTPRITLGTVAAGNP